MGIMHHYSHQFILSSLADEIELSVDEYRLVNVVLHHRQRSDEPLSSFEAAIRLDRSPDMVPIIMRSLAKKGIRL